MIFRPLANVAEIHASPDAPDATVEIRPADCGGLCRGLGVADEARQAGTRNSARLRMEEGGGGAAHGAP